MVTNGRSLMLNRRQFSAGLGAILLSPSFAVAAAAEGVVDMAGRQVSLIKPAERIVLLDARDIVSMAVLHPDPARVVIGWAGADTLDSDLLRRHYETRPDGSGEIAVVGGQTATTVSLERILALKPDLVVTTAYMEPELGDGVLTRRLEAAGIPVVFSNTASNEQTTEADRDPFAAMARTMRMWGQILGKSDRAETFVGFAHEHLNEVRQRLGATSPTKAYLEVQSTYDDCCWAAGDRIWGDLLALAGGHNLSAVDAPWFAKVALEQLIAEAPEIYIASGGAFGRGIRPAIGPGLDPDEGGEGLRRLTERTGFETLPAVQDGRVHGVWTGLLTIAPFNILFVECAAKWLHPDLFADLEPTDTLNALNEQFLAKPLPGPCWLSLAA
ncbi:ABC transporter substrate-binding protein [Amorphus sp. 3PC139-8]|uniref:ABC transporter substrate-binding protein n=1 Tax=Amorphus sp. 3PC139-8 TaxID=2735676 RepID=UPI00345D4018